MLSGKNSSSKCLKICCGITAIFLIILAAVLTVLWFTTLTPKDPEVTAHPIGLEKINPFSMLSGKNVPLNMSITIDNRKNVASFEFEDTTSQVDYRGDVVSEVPMRQNVVPACGALNIMTSADLMVGRMIKNPVFMKDVAAGSLNMTSMALLHGKVNLFNLVKRPATAITTCEFSFSIRSRIVQSTCKCKLKI